MNKKVTKLAVQLFKHLFDCDAIYFTSTYHSFYLILFMRADKYSLEDKKRKTKVNKKNVSMQNAIYRECILKWSDKRMFRCILRAVTHDFRCE